MSLVLGPEWVLSDAETALSLNREFDTEGLIEAGKELMSERNSLRTEVNRLESTKSEECVKLVERLEKLEEEYAELDAAVSALKMLGKKRLGVLIGLVEEARGEVDFEDGLKLANWTHLLTAWTEQKGRKRIKR